MTDGMQSTKSLSGPHEATGEADLDQKLQELDNGKDEELHASLQPSNVTSIEQTQQSTDREDWRSPLEEAHAISISTDTFPDSSRLSTPVEPSPPPNLSIYPLQTRSGYGVIVTQYNPDWPSQFDTIKLHLQSVFKSATLPVTYNTIEHIGSTSVPGLAAKPNIDVLVTLPNRTALNAAVEALEWEIPSAPLYTRYTRVSNDRQMEGRQSFKLRIPEWSEHYYTTPERSVYLIDQSPANEAGRFHIRGYRSVRETLQNPANEDLLQEYANVKIELAQRTYDDSITYSLLKNDVIREILTRAGWTAEEIDLKERLAERVSIPTELPY